MNSFSIIMLAGHRQISMEDVKSSLKSDIYVRLLIELVRNKWAEWAELWTYADEETSFDFYGVKVRTITDWNTLSVDKPADIVFVRADRRLFIPSLKQGIAKRSLFYCASSQGFPRHYKRFHGILVDDKSHISIVRKFYPHAYIAPFIKTAVPETFSPVQNIHKDYDLCIAGKFHENVVNTFDDIYSVLRNCNGLRIVLCGKTDEAFKNQLPISDNSVTFTGRLPHDELNKIFNRSKLALLTEARVDAAPRVVLEYMASGVPILANEKLASVRKFILPGSGEIASAQQFPETAKTMLQNLDAYNPRRVFEENFAPAKAAADLAEHIQQVLAMPETPPKPSWKGRLCRMLRSRLDEYT